MSCCAESTYRLGWRRVVGVCGFAPSQLCTATLTSHNHRDLGFAGKSLPDRLWATPYCSISVVGVFKFTVAHSPTRPSNNRSRSRSTMRGTCDYGIGTQMIRFGTACVVGFKTIKTSGIPSVSQSYSALYPASLPINNQFLITIPLWSNSQWVICRRISKPRRLTVQLPPKDYPHPT